MKRKLRLVFRFLLPMALACGDGSRSELRPAPMESARMIVASEFDSYATVMRQLDRLAAHPGTALCLAIRAEESQSPDLADLLRWAAEQRVPVTAWLLLPESEGYWFSETNFESARRQTLEFLSWVETESLPLEWVMFDMELELEMSRRMENGDLFEETVPMLRTNRDAAAFAQGTESYARLVREVQARGYKVSAAAYPFILDDLNDGDADIQDAFNTPIEGVPFDEIYFMAYRTSFASLAGVMPGSDLVWEYAQEAEARFGSQGVIGLGIIGNIGQLQDTGFVHPRQLEEDIAAARAGGTDRVFVFSLDGMLASGDPDAWLARVDTAAARPQPTAETAAARGIFTALDALLE